jgi:hypothetical protein
MFSFSQSVSTQPLVGKQLEQGTLACDVGPAGDGRLSVRSKHMDREPVPVVIGADQDAPEAMIGEEDSNFGHGANVFPPGEEPTVYTADLCDLLGCEKVPRHLNRGAMRGRGTWTAHADLLQALVLR